MGVEWPSRLGCFASGRWAGWSFRCPWRSGGRGSPLDPDQAAHVVGEVGERDARGGADRADAAHDRAPAALPGGEHMLDQAAPPCPGRLAATDGRRHRPSAWLGALELGHEAAPVERFHIGPAAMGGVGPDPAGRVVRIEHRAELAAVVPRRMRDAETADEAVPAIDAERVLVAEHRHRDLGRGPTSDAAIGRPGGRARWSSGHRGRSAAPAPSTIPRACRPHAGSASPPASVAAAGPRPRWHRRSAHPWREGRVPPASHRTARTAWPARPRVGCSR